MWVIHLFCKLFGGHDYDVTEYDDGELWTCRLWTFRKCVVEQPNLSC